MHTRSLYVISKEPHAGSLFVSMGLMEILKRQFKRVAFFKPIVAAEEKEEDIETVLTLFGMDQRSEEAQGISTSEAEVFLARGEEAKLYETLISRFESLHDRYDFVLCLGFFDPHLIEVVDFDLNLRIAKNFSSPVAGVVSARGKSLEAAQEDILLWERVLKEEGLKPFAFFINHVQQTLACDMDIVKPFKGVPCFPIPYEEEIDKPTVLDLLEVTGGEILDMKDERRLEQTINKSLIAAMRPEHFLRYFEEGDLVIVPSDRSDILLAVLAANQAKGFPSASAVVIGGEMDPAENILQLLASDEMFRIVLIKVPLDTMQIAMQAQKMVARITPKHRRKTALALGHFAKYVDTELIEKSLAKSELDIVTPAMFLHRIFARAARKKERIVLPESMDDRVLRAAEIIFRRNLAEIVILGEKASILDRAGILGIDLEGIEFVDPLESGYLERFAQKFYELREAKGITLDEAKDTMKNWTYFATMMVYEGMVDAMVSGATHTTRETVLPALQIIKTKPGIDIVSSIFFMCLDTRVLVYGDCAIVPDPTPSELAQIAIESAETAKAFGIEPIVAMLSYSTGESGVGEDVEKVREATKIAQSLRPDLLIEGPMQYDAAIDPEVGRRKMPGSRVAGRATVFIFPDLNTGNNTYKAVQRATGAIAIGPVLQGLRKPVNDLSRGCSVEDIVSTVAITAIQAQKS
ncbi:phosphate acetyltransferase [Hydrogenimonas cancrithermarum]|uniref:Phosphate acetyltransferase n=1 Tax=Hydrogenimonas cancrithermarum TaxID=2993563 RepID=A0ABN6WX77_9BACT|nr:phosphate acetyltransferase [Hydrogenimonas cancrithermarum]BDY13864.1 phosphate acetyltransferase [Hydrogenimonas cancrithermarum]